MTSSYVQPVEEYSFLIQDFKAAHINQNDRTEEVTLNIKVHYAYVPALSNTAYPDSRDIATSIENYLTCYPNKRDYWEVINEGLTLMVIGTDRALVSVTSELRVMPTAKDAHANESRVTCRR